jgi:hypothetical protein
MTVCGPRTDAFAAMGRLPLPLAGEGGGGGARHMRRLLDMARQVRARATRSSSSIRPGGGGGPPLPTLPRKRGREFASES